MYIHYIFVTEFVNLGNNPPFYEVNQQVGKCLGAWRDLKKLLPMYLYTIDETLSPKKSSLFYFDQDTDV